LSPLRARLEYLAILGVASLFRRLPISISRAIAVGVGILASRILKLRRKVCASNLLQAFPALTASEIEVRYHAIWKHFALVGAELARVPGMSLAQFDRYVDGQEIEKLREIAARGKGAIFVSGHLGNWEWLGAMTARAGLPITYVIAPQTNKLVEDWINDMRAAAGIEIISRRDAIRGTLQALKRGRIVAMLCDQDAGDPGVFVPFFGALASTPRGPALFHIKTGAPLVFGACCRQADGRYKMAFEEISLPPLSGDRERDEFTIMSLVTKRLEDEIRSYPDQYLWLHRRWKTKPK
jgi:Kdo2-lipid IVA lauroyltransferase/acyltransferase